MTASATSAPAVYRLSIERFRGINSLTWHPARGVNVILGGGDVGKTTILDAIGLLLSPMNAGASDTDYFARKIEAGFLIEAVMSLPPGCGINYQFKPSWLWEWDGKDAVVPNTENDGKDAGEPVYKLRVRGTEDLDLAYEIVQPDGTTDGLSVPLRRSIGLVRLGGDDRNDRDLRLVQGSALDRLLSDKGLRSRMASELAKSDVKDELTADAQKALTELDQAFREKSLPDGLDLAITGGHGASIASLVGLTAACQGVQLPLSSWGAGTRRRLSALAIAEQKQGEAPITMVDEIERGLEPYRQRALVEKLQAGKSQVFLTTHSPPAIAATSKAGIWYVDHTGKIGPLDGLKIARHRKSDPETFLARLAVVGEGITEVSFAAVLLEKALGCPLEQHGVIAGAYHMGIGLPADVALWVREQNEGHAQLALKVATLVKRCPMIAASLAQRYPTVICDEHQDSSGDQHAIVMAMLAQGARVRILADPMQKIFRDKPFVGSNPACDWDELAGGAQSFEQLDKPHRWNAGCSQLGEWTLKARAALKAGGRIDLRSGLPSSVQIVFAENQAQKALDYQIFGNDRKPIDNFEKAQSSLLILTRQNQTATSLRSFFSRRILLWEGHTRYGLERLVDAVGASQGDPTALAAAIVTFMGEVAKGFSPSAFGDRFVQEAKGGCTGKAKGKPASIQNLARFIVAEPDHRGVAKMLAQLDSYRASDPAFKDIEIDHHREFYEAIRLGDFAAPADGLAEITHRRTYSRPKPPGRAISTIHKAKGLECESAIVMPCDAKAFPDKLDARCLLYVALSRAKSRLLLVVSRKEPSPLLLI